MSQNDLMLEAILWYVLTQVLHFCHCGGSSEKVIIYGIMNKITSLRKAKAA